MACGIHFGINKPTAQSAFLLKISGSAYSVINLVRMNCYYTKSTQLQDNFISYVQHALVEII